MNYDLYSNSVYGNVGNKQVSAVPSNDDFHIDHLHSSTLLYADNYKPTQSSVYDADSVAPTFQKENTDFVAGNAGDYNAGSDDSGGGFKDALGSMAKAMTQKKDDEPKAHATDNGALAAIMAKGAPALGAVPDSSAVNPYLMSTSRLLGLTGGNQ